MKSFLVFLLIDQFILFAAALAFFTELRLISSENAYGPKFIDDHHRIDVFASLADHADLPSWIRYYQRPNSSVGLFYGSPLIDDDGDVIIDIILLDRFNFNVSRKKIQYRILNRDEIYRYSIEVNYSENFVQKLNQKKNEILQIQMKFFDMDIQDFYEKNLTSLVVEIFAKKLWRIDSNNHSIYLIRVLRPIDIGLRFPLNPEEKEGLVY
ncbi:hypothetical protein SSS_01021 [Sarcoptes scabiei]|uniref:Sarcoglycan alpha/epsilon N-terminal domain-containing protein n=1 Tax=Sarcoptes scabiei TaxID=52283 RepID=A0A834RDP4_SARSC|nr:hypothetical protein SSS_01021 [Sarcoptes scabiei]